MKRVLPFVLVLLVVLCGPVWAVPIGDGLGVSLSLDPAGNNVTRMATITNTNKALPTQVLDFSITARVLPSGLLFTIAGQVEVTGDSGVRQVELGMSVPTLATLVPGSVKVNNIVQPNPTIVGGSYKLTVTVPAATTTTTGAAIVEDRLTMNLPLVAQLIRAPVSTALLIAENAWAAAACVFGISE